MNIVIPMMGNSNRFKKAGYKTDKYKLRLQNYFVFDLALLSFNQYFDKCVFIFVVPKERFEAPFITERCRELGIQHFKIVELKHSTRGQAETVYLAADYIESGPITIFNIDSFRVQARLLPSSGAVGWVEVFDGCGDHWSFFAFDRLSHLTEAAEKVRISKWASTGLYGFESITFFKKIYVEAVHTGYWKQGERYISPLYNIAKNYGKIKVIKSEKHENIFCGTPQEYENLKQNPKYITHLLGCIK